MSQPPFSASLFWFALALKTVDPALEQNAPFKRFALERWNRFVHETEFQ